MLREGIHAFTDDEVIQYPDINQVQGGFEFIGDHFIRLAGFADAGRVVVGEYQGCALCFSVAFTTSRG